jgi:hypothetical protein
MHVLCGTFWKDVSSRPNSRTLANVAKMPHLLPLPRYASVWLRKILRDPVVRLCVAAFCMLQPAIVPAAETPGALPGGWRLLRAPNPQGGPEAISVSHTADVTRSDLDLAGIMLKCSDHGPEIVIVVVTPFPPREQPQVTIAASGQEWRFAASIVPPGAQLLLPPEAVRLATGPWQTAHELSVKITSPGQSFGGVVPVDGLAAAFAELSVKCRAG